MFRRRTDQVYSTLQQVQRRITEQTGVQDQHDLLVTPPQQPQPGRQPLEQALPSGTPAPTSVPAPAPVADTPTQAPHQVVQPLVPLHAPAVTQMPPQVTHMPAPASQPSSATYYNPASNRYGPGGKRYVLQLSGDMAMLLLVVWIASMAVMFVLGRYWHNAGGAGLAAGPAGNRDVTAMTPQNRLGDYVLLLQSLPDASVDNVNYLEGRAKGLNEFVRNNSSRGWKPYFGVRKPINGGVELAYGLVNGVWGIDKEEFVEFAKLLSAPKEKNGAGFGQARWVKVGE